MSDVKYLVKVDPVSNNSKFYKMIPNGSDFIVEYGRLGNTNYQTSSYPISQWEKKYKEKIKKGYEDKSELIQELVEEVKQDENDEYLPIPNQAIQKIVDRLQEYADNEIKRQYQVSSSQVTNAMIEEAQNLINALNNCSQDLEKFNKTLIELFKVIPRKMKTVKENLANSIEDIPKIYQREQDLLDVMKGRVVQIQKSPKQEIKNTSPKETILEALGLEITETSEEDVTIIKHELGEISDKFYNAWKVTNRKTQERFDKYIETVNNKTTKLLFHGSRSENWWSIINSGLVLRPNAIISGKMFGSGIYFAPKARKSLGYTSLEGSYWANGSNKCGFMAVFEIHYGNPYVTYDNYNFDYDFSYKDLQKLGDYDCVHAKAGRSLRNDEIIIYQECQCTIKYLIELR